MRRKIVTPSVPNFIRVEVLRAFFMVPLSEFDDEELDEMAKQWRFALYENRDRQLGSPDAPEAKESK
jgi:hypothetical protein